MATTSTTNVRVILPASTALTDAQIQAAIDAASCVVDQLADCSCGNTLTSDCLDIILTYLAAHFAAVTENTLTLSSEKSPCGVGSASYGFKFGEGILGTPFGQMANTMSSGCLAQFDKTPVDIFTIGTIGDC